MKEEKFSCKKGDMTIRGFVFYQEENNGIPAIVSHGFGGCMDRTIPYAKALAELGYVGYAYDFCGGGPASTSDGSFHDYMTVYTEVDDLKTVIEYVGTKGHDMDKLILAGSSQGGFVSALVAADMKQGVHDLILNYPAFCIPDDARKGKMQTMFFDPDNIPPHIGEMPRMVSGAYARTAKDIDIFEKIKGYKGNVLLMHGTADSIVDYSYAIKANQSYMEAGTNIEFHLIEGADHGFRDAHFSEAMGYISAFLAKNQ